MWKILLCLCACIATGMAAYVSMATDPEWQAFKVEHNKTYRGLDEEIYRHTIWQQNREFITSHNKKADRGEYTYWVGMNHFGDWTRQEYRDILSNSLLRKASRRADAMMEIPVDVTDLPSEVDWNAKGYVTPVQNQLQCGSCWAFSATAPLEAQHKMATGQLVLLSAQNLLDCSQKQGNNGCNGGLMDYAFEYIRVNNGIDTEAAYPYVGQNQDCRFTRAGVGANLTGYKDVPKGSELGLQKAVAEVGPVGAGVDADSMDFQLYKSGIYSNPSCNPDQLGHSLTVTGYGTLNGVEYWDNKNSWGPKWGENGYIKIARNKNNMCGIATEASYPIV